MGETQSVRQKKFANQNGFTLIELLMVILVIAILALIAIAQFINYGKDSRDAATRSNLQLLRRGISEKNGMMRVRCNIQDSSFPAVASINANDITIPTHVEGDITTGPCTVAQVPVSADRFYVALSNTEGGNNGIPVNPWGFARAFLVTDCIGTAACPGGVTDRSVDCVTGVAHTSHSDGWCYNHVTGEIWANSRNNLGDGLATGDENTY